jgi:hypothetical protein
MFWSCDFGCFRAEIVADSDGATIVEPHFLTMQEPEEGHPDSETAMFVVEEAARQIALRALAALGELEVHRPKSTQPDYQLHPIQTVTAKLTPVRRLP